MAATYLIPSDFLLNKIKHVACLVEERCSVMNFSFTCHSKSELHVRKLDVSHEPLPPNPISLPSNKKLSIIGTKKSFLC